MHFTAAALLLLLVPTTRAAAIPNQGDLSGASDAFLNNGDLSKALGTDALKGAHVDGPATGTLDESGNPLVIINDAPAEVGNIVGEAADNVVDRLVAAKRDEAADAKANIKRGPPLSFGPLSLDLTSNVIDETDDILESLVRDPEATGLPIESAEDAVANIALQKNKAVSRDADDLVEDVVEDTPIIDYVDNPLLDGKPLMKTNQAAGSVGSAVNEILNQER
jgi:hypothetical protein